MRRRHNETASTNTLCHGVVLLAVLQEVLHKRMRVAPVRGGGALVQHMHQKGVYNVGAQVSMSQIRDRRHHSGLRYPARMGRFATDGHAPST